MELSLKSNPHSLSFISFSHAAPAGCRHMERLYDAESQDETMLRAPRLLPKARKNQAERLAPHSPHEKVKSGTGFHWRCESPKPPCSSSTVVIVVMMIMISNTIIGIIGGCRQHQDIQIHPNTSDHSDRPDFPTSSATRLLECHEVPSYIHYIVTTADI